jgi:hypothetical protein
MKLGVNCEKSAVDLATRRTLLGFAFFKRGGEIKVRIDPKARKRAKDRLRLLTSRSWGVSMERRITSINRFSRGWTAYFALADTPSVFEELDEWLRRRLRQARWKEWKKIRTKRRNLIAAGIPAGKALEWANSRKGYWRVAGSWVSPAASTTLTGANRDCLVSPIPTAASGMRREPPDADPHVRWCGRGRGKPGPYPIERSGIGSSARSRGAGSQFCYRDAV